MPRTTTASDSRRCLRPPAVSGAALAPSHDMEIFEDTPAAVIYLASCRLLLKGLEPVNHGQTSSYCGSAGIAVPASARGRLKPSSKNSQSGRLSRTSENETSSPSSRSNPVTRDPVPS